MKRIRHITADRIMSWRLFDGTLSREFVEAAFAGRRSLTPLEVAGSDLPARTILRVVLRPEVIPARELRLIACWCVERTMRAERRLGRRPDRRSWVAVRVARLFASGRATKRELAKAEVDAWAVNTERPCWIAVDSALTAASHVENTVEVVWAARDADAMLRHVRRVLRRIG